MKNFPNQASDFARLRETLATIDEMRHAGRDVANDGELGYELARRKHYTFRHFDYDAPDAAVALEARIQEEQAKPGSKQGARTNAREMRRTLVALGWLTPPSFDLTAKGHELLATAPGSLVERDLLAEGLLQLSVTDDSGTSHPVRILLNLLAVAPAKHRDGLELVLEAHDDSPGELARVTELYRLPQEERYAALETLGVTLTQIRNAVKIFPTLAKTAGLIVQDESGTFSLSPDGRSALHSPTPVARPRVTPARPRSRTHRPVTASTIAGRSSGVPSVGLSLEEQERARALLTERTDRHQQLVRDTAHMISAPGSFYESPTAYDLLWVPDDESLPLVLFEMKTLNGDARSQTRLAVAQLSWYHFFDVSPDWPTRAVIEVAVYDADPGPEPRRYLEHEQVVAIVVERAGEWRQINSLEPNLPALLGLP